MMRNDRKVAIGTATLALVALVVVWFIGGRGHDIKHGLLSDADSSRHTSNNGQWSSDDNYSKSSNGQDNETYYAIPERKVERFIFDPNTADSTALLRLGLRPWQVKNIYRYRAKGGIYRKKEDFARLYGLTVKEYHELEPYIRISPDYQPASTLFDKKQKHNDTLRHRRDSTLRYPNKLKEGEFVVLNTADSTELQRVPGIGSYFARQIVRQGQRLGGYVSVDQLDDIKDFPEESKRYFTISQPSPRKLAINRLSLEELRRHPYINYYMAKAIIDYRRIHGAITSLQELRLSRAFTPEAIQRLEPYVAY